MFEYNDAEHHYDAAHHPFTSPMDEDLEQFKQAVETGERELLGGIRAKAYDAVINGIEVAGGSIRIHQKDVQALNFKALGMTPEKARERFGFFLDALEYGTPPHGGFAAGIERTLMTLLGKRQHPRPHGLPENRLRPGPDDGFDRARLIQSQLNELGDQGVRPTCVIRRVWRPNGV